MLISPEFLCRYPCVLRLCLSHKCEPGLKHLMNLLHLLIISFSLWLLQASQLVSEGEMTAEDFLESSHKLRVQQQVTREEEEDKADDIEVQEFDNLRQASCWSRTLASYADLLWARHEHVTKSRPRSQDLSSVRDGKKRDPENEVGGRVPALELSNTYELRKSCYFLSFEVLLIDSKE